MLSSVHTYTYWNPSHKMKTLDIACSLSIEETDTELRSLLESRILGSAQAIQLSKTGLNQ